MEKSITDSLVELRTGLEQYLDRKFESQMNPIKNTVDKVVAAQDQMIAKGQSIPLFGEAKSFGEVFAAEVANQLNIKQAEVKNFQNDKHAKLRFDLKLAGTMMTSVNLTGDSQMSYNNRQALVPNQRINFRDLIPSTSSPTGTYVTYRETGGEGAIAVQTEGQSKSQIDYDFTEVKTVSGYLAGFARFSKQMMYHLPWLQTTLSRMLLRDFYKKENDKFYDQVVAAATGFNTSIETDDAKMLIDVLMGRLDSNFNNSFVLVKNSQKGALLKLLYENGFYMGAGSVIGTPNGNVSIADTPIIGVSWADADKIVVIDNDFIERVETESLRVEFSYEDADNFTKNLVTARIECFEDLNILRTEAHSVMSNES